MQKLRENPIRCEMSLPKQPNVISTMSVACLQNINHYCDGLHKRLVSTSLVLIASIKFAFL